MTRLAGLFLAVLTFSAADFIGPRAAAQTSRASPNVGRSDDKSPSIVPEIARRMDSPQHPMPLIPVLVPQIKTAQELDEVLTGKIPTLFYLTQAEGPDADMAQLAFFQELAVEYPNSLNFRKIAAGSEAATRLHSGVVTKPVYSFYVPAQSGLGHVVAVLDEAQVDGQSVTQVVLEGLTKKYLGLAPTLFSPFALTSENEHKAIYEYHPPEGSSSTAKWITVLFFPGVPEWEGRSNRLRVLLGIERFFYPSRMRFAEVDLSKEGGVYRTLIHNGADLPLPTEPELWVIDPDTHRAAKYTSPKGETIADLTHERLRDWLTSNSVALPTDGGLVTQRAFPELERLQKQTQDELRADPASSKGPP